MSFLIESVRGMTDAEVSRKYAAAKNEMKRANDAKKKALANYRKADAYMEKAEKLGTVKPDDREAYKRAYQKSTESFQYVAKLDSYIAQIAEELRQRRAARSVGKQNPRSRRQNAGYGAMRRLTDRQLSQQYTAAKLEMRAAENKKKSAYTRYLKALERVDRPGATRQDQIAFKQAEQDSTAAHKYVASLDATLAQMFEELRQRRAARSVGKQNPGGGVYRHMTRAQLDKRYQDLHKERALVRSNADKAAITKRMRTIEKIMGRRASAGVSLHRSANPRADIVRIVRDQIKAGRTVTQMKKHLKDMGLNAKHLKEAADIYKVEKSYVRSMAAGRYTNGGRRRNQEKRDADHPIEVVKHFRSGPPGYLTPWQRARAAGQEELFDTGIQPAKVRSRKNPQRSWGESRERTHEGEERNFVGFATRWYDTGLSTAQVIGKLRATGFTQAQSKRIAASARASQRLAGKYRKRNTTVIKRAKYVVANGTGAGATSAKQLHQTFTGKESKRSRVLHVAPRTPKQLAQLGRLVSITTTRGKIKLARRNPADETVLCADSRGRLHIASTAESLGEIPAGNLGQVIEIEYSTAKPHLGHNRPTLFFHEMGEEGGARPMLVSDGEGHLVFQGGDYEITAEGIRN